jgi:hypothetical protein
MRTLVFALIALAPVQSALAKECYNIKFENETRVPVKIVWRADGCAGLEKAPKSWADIIGLYFDTVCRHRTVDSGKSDSYTVKWGQSKPSAYLQFDYKVNGQTRTVIDRTVYKRKNKHGFIQDFKLNQGRDTPVNCKTDYTYTYTQKDLMESVNFFTNAFGWDE